MVSTYPPTQCGIATFARSLGDAMVSAEGEVEIIALGEGPVSGVRHAHRGPQDLEATGQVMDGYDVILIQHEFGIYDGPDGEDVLAILARAHPPVISVVHTVPAAPSNRQRRILQTLLDVSDAIVVLSHSADRALRRDYDVRPESLRVIPHGAPDLGRPRRPRPPTDRPRLLTWGLLSRGKGIEWGIRALAHLDDLDPAPEYVIAGCTHPKVRAWEGEALREELTALARDLGVGDRVRFIDSYMTTAELADLVATASAYLLPYDSREQITSGVLVEAMVAGGPVIATRFPHALELLGNGTGFLVDHEDPQAIATALRTVVEQPLTALRMRELAAALSQGFLWPHVGEAYLRLADGLWRGQAHANGLSGVLHSDFPGLLRAIS
ncbi:MAG: glycosyltransferase [Candidatus Nanopelagicales bacterium]